MPEYPNPLIPGFNPDPSCVLVDGVYYLITSSFEYLPALPIYRSTDFTNWEHIGNVATREEQVGLALTPSQAGVWAPTIRHHNGLFHVIVCVTASPRGCVVFTADDPSGPWSDGVTIDGVDGIDPDLSWDESGTAYITWSDLRFAGDMIVSHDGIRQARADLEAGKLLEAPRRLWSGTGLVAAEAPHLYQRDGFWYLMIAEGGTGWGHSVSVARSRDIEGPFEGAPGNPLLRPAGDGSPVCCAGHADLVRAPDGDDVLVLLATRTAGSHAPLGRETYASTVNWVDGWPVPSPVQFSPRPAAVDENFDFANESALSDPGWLAVGRTPAEVVSVTERPGHLTIRATSGGLDAFRPDFIGRRQRHHQSLFSTRIDVTEGRGGLGMRYDEDFTIALIAENAPPSNTTRITARASLPTVSQSWTADIAGDDVTLLIETESPSATAPWAASGDRIRLAVLDARGFKTTLAELDGRFWSVETVAAFTGRVTGMFAEEGIVHFKDFRYHGGGGS